VPVDLQPILDFANKLTIVGLLTLDLVAVVVGLQRRWWVPGWMYQEKVSGEQAWRDVALRNAGVAARTTAVAETVVPVALGRDNAASS